MKTEFLKNFKVNDQELPKDIIDAILAENGRDIEAAKKPFADYDSIKEQLQAAKDGLKAFEGVDVTQLQGEITKLQGQLTDKDKEWQGITIQGNIKKDAGKQHHLEQFQYITNEREISQNNVFIY